MTAELLLALPSDGKDHWLIRGELSLVAPAPAG